MFGVKKLRAEVDALRAECSDLKGQVELMGREMVRMIQSQQPEGKAIISVPSEEGELWLKKS